jgi:hypothetical protein
MKARMDWSSEEERSTSLIAALRATLPFLGPGITAALALCLLVGTVWTNCEAYTLSDEDRFNQPSLALQGILREEGNKKVETMESDNRPALSGAPRGISQPFKRRRDPDTRKPENAWSAPGWALSGEMAPTTGSDRERTGRSAEERAAQEIGLYGWSEDLRRYAVLVFDRDQRVLANQLTHEPTLVDSIKTISPFQPASTLPGGLQWPELNSYEIWVAELLGL